MRPVHILSASIVTSLLFASPLLADNWQSMSIADQSTRGPSFTLDANDYPVAVWGEPASGGGYDLMFSRFDGVEWSTPTVFFYDPPEVYESIRFDIKMRDDGQFWVCWEAECVAFRTALLTEAGSLDGFCDVFTPGYETISLAIDLDGWPQFSFFDQPHADAEWAKLVDLETCEFVYCTIDGGSQVGKGSDIEIDSEGFTHVIYYDQSTHSTVYATGSCDDWTKEIVCESANGGGAVLRLGPDNQPHVLVKDESTGEWRYVYRTNDGWTSELDNVLPLYGEHSPAFAVDANGIAHTFIRNVVDGTLWYLWFDGAWNSEQLPAEYDGMTPQHVECESEGNPLAMLRDVDTCLHMLQTDGLDLTLDGECPGFFDICVTGANPDDRCAIIYGFQYGSAGPVPGCPDLYVDIMKPKVAGTGRAVGNGEFCILGYVPAGGCGRVLVQGIDLDTCEVTPPYLIE